MENKARAKLIPIFFLTLFLAIGYFAIKITVENITSDTPAKTRKEEVKINTKVYDSIYPQNDSGAAVTLEPGYGRDNPFAAYK